MTTAPRPRSLAAAIWYWGAAAIAVAACAVAAWAGVEFLTDVPPAMAVGLAVLLSALALVLGWGTLRLSLGHLAGRLTLTTLGLVAGLPALVKGGRLLPLAIALLLGVVLLYLPGTRAFFRDQVRARRSKNKATR